MSMRNWAIPKFIYGEIVTVLPLDGILARVVDLHFYGQAGCVEYDVRYFHEGREHKIRVFEDEISPTDGTERSTTKGEDELPPASPPHPSPSGN